jgi:hypothetical protein
MVGAAIAMWLGFRAVFGAAAIFYLTAAALALWGLPWAIHAGICIDRSDPQRPRDS